MLRYIKYALMLSIFVYSTYNLIHNIQLQNAVIKMPDIPATKSPNQKLKPIGIKIGVANINLPVEMSTVENGKWQYNKTGISYLEETPLPGLKGNAVFYGHNWPNLLGNLNKLSRGTRLTFLLSAGTTKDFIVNSKFVVLLNETHILKKIDEKKSKF